MVDEIERPHWIVCALNGYNNQNKTWCERTPKIFEFTFLNASHALFNKMNKGRLILCPECCNKIIKTLKQED